MKPTTTDNRDPRWSPETEAAIEAKVDEAMALAPRLSLSADGRSQLGEEERRRVLLVSFREVVKATSLDTLMTAPPGLLEQLSVLAVVNNENVKGILVQVIRVFMLLWGTPETNAQARKMLRDMEEYASQELPKLALRPEAVLWKPMPVK